MYGILAEQNVASWVDAAIALTAALVGAAVGGLASAWGGRRAMRSDLLERNRHALLMEDVPRVEAAVTSARWEIENDAAGVSESTEGDLRAAVFQLKIRAAILGQQEQDYGAAIPELDEMGRHADDMAYLSEAVRQLARVSVRIISTQRSR